MAKNKFVVNRRRVGLTTVKTDFVDPLGNRLKMHRLTMLAHDQENFIVHPFRDDAPPLPQSEVAERIAFDVLGENHYRYYEFYGNMAIAIPFCYAAKCVADGFWPPPFGWASLGVVFLEAIFLVGSRDTARKYFTRMDQLLDTAKPSAEAQTRYESSFSPPNDPSESFPDGGP